MDIRDVRHVQDMDGAGRAGLNGMHRTEFVVRTLDGHRVLEVSGEVDLANADAFRAAVVDADRVALVEALDLTRCTYMDSTGIGVVVALYKALDKPVPVSVRRGSHLVRLFTVAGVGEIMDLSEVT
jgi:anti-sigma B factor antagonist